MAYAPKHAARPRADQEQRKKRVIAEQRERRRYRHFRICYRQRQPRYAAARSQP